jgi:transcriptional regulator with XRE-family HTH domain
MPTRSPASTSSSPNKGETGRSRTRRGNPDTNGAGDRVADGAGDATGERLNERANDRVGDLDQIVSSIGPKLRELRLQRRLSLQQLAERADVSAAAIHKIERSGMVPTITTLLKLAAALDRPVAYFVDEDAEQADPVIFTPGDDRGTVYTSHRGIDLAGISGPYGKFFVAAAVASVDPGASSGPTPMEHAGEELVYVLDGGLEFVVDGQAYQLAPGDSLHWRTDRRHQWRNPGKQTAHAIWMALRPG